MGDRVFVSHSTRDKAVVDDVCAALDREGVAYWLAPRDIPPGAPYGRAVLAGIKDSRAVVLVLSAAAAESAYVLNEVEYAVREKVPVIPFRIEDLPPGRGLEHLLAGVHHVDAAAPPHGARVPELAAAVRRHLAGAVPAGAAPPAPGCRKVTVTMTFSVVSLGVALLIVAWVDAGRRKSNTPMLPEVGNLLVGTSEYESNLLILRATIDMERGDYDRAVAELSEAILLDPACAEAYALRSVAFAAKGDPAAAGRDRALAELYSGGRPLDQIVGGAVVELPPFEPDDARPLPAAPE